MKMKLFLKILVLIGVGAASYQAAIAIADSLSQGALTEANALLLAFLIAVTITFAILFALAWRTKETFTISNKRPYFRFTIPWAALYAWNCLSFYLIAIFDVHNYYWPHIVATACGIGGATLYAWNYFKGRRSRHLFRGLVLAADGYFVYNFLYHPEQIDLGEVAISFVLLAVVWVTLNEKINK